MGSRIAKRLRLRRGDCSTSKPEDSDNKKHHHHGYNRRQSSGHRHSSAYQDIISQCLQSLAKVAEPVSASTSDATTSTSQPGNAADATNQTDAQMHCKNAEKYAKASMHVFSNLAQNFTNMMDPFAAAFAFEADKLQTDTPLIPEPAFSGVATVAATEKPSTETPPAAKPQSEQPPPEKPSVEKSVEKPSTSAVVVDAAVASAPEAQSIPTASITSVRSNASEASNQQKVGDWTMLDVNDLAEEIHAAPSAAAHESTQKPSSSNEGAIPKSAAAKARQLPDYEELSRALRSHIEEFQQIFKAPDNGKEESMQSKKTQTPPATPEAQVAPEQRHPG